MSIEIVINRMNDGSFHITGRTEGIAMTQEHVHKDDLIVTVDEVKESLTMLEPPAEVVPEDTPELLVPDEEAKVD